MDYWGCTLMTCLSISILVSGLQSGWRPLKSKPDFIIGPRIVYSSKKPSFAHSCSLYKAVMTQHTFEQVSVFRNCFSYTQQQQQHTHTIFFLISSIPSFYLLLYVYRSIIGSEKIKYIFVENRELLMVRKLKTFSLVKFTITCVITTHPVHGEH